MDKVWSNYTNSLFLYKRNYDAQDHPLDAVEANNFNLLGNIFVNVCKFKYFITALIKTRISFLKIYLNFRDMGIENYYDRVENNYKFNILFDSIIMDSCILHPFRVLDFSHYRLPNYMNKKFNKSEIASILSSDRIVNDNTYMDNCELNYTEYLRCYSIFDNLNSSLYKKLNIDLEDFDLNYKIINKVLYIKNDKNLTTISHVVFSSDWSGITQDLILVHRYTKFKYTTSSNNRIYFLKNNYPLLPINKIQLEKLEKNNKINISDDIIDNYDCLRSYNCIVLRPMYTLNAIFGI